MDAEEFGYRMRREVENLRASDPDLAHINLMYGMRDVLVQIENNRHVQRNFRELCVVIRNVWEDDDRAKGVVDVAVPVQRRRAAALRRRDRSVPFDEGGPEQLPIWNEEGETGREPVGSSSSGTGDSTRPAWHDEEGVPSVTNAEAWEAYTAWILEHATLPSPSS